MAINSFLDPNAAANSQSPSIANYRANQLGYLQPLVSDLLTQKSANTYSKPTFQADPEAIKDRLAQYQVYNASKMGGLANYFRQGASASKGNTLLFKPEDFSALSSALGGVETSQLGNLNPLIGDVKPIGSMGNQTYFNQDALKNQLAKYGAVDLPTVNQMAPMMGGLNALSEFGGNAYYDKQALMDQLNKYKSADFSGINLPGMEAVTPIATVNNKKFYTNEMADRVGQILGNYGKIPDSLVAQYANNPIIQGLGSVGSANGTKLYNIDALNSALSQASLEGVKGVYGGDVYNQGYTDPGALSSILNQDTWSNSQNQYYANKSNQTNQVYNWLANQLLSGQTPSITPAILEKLGRGKVTTFGQTANLGNLANTLYRYTPIEEYYHNLAPKVGMTPAEMDSVARYVAADTYKKAAQSNDQYVFNVGSNNTPQYVDAINKYVSGKYGQALPQSVLDSITDTGNQLTQTLVDYKNSVVAANDKAREAGEGWNASWNAAWGPLAPYASTLLKFTPLAPASYVFDIARAAENKDWGSVIGSALGAYAGVSGSSPTTDLGSAVSSGLNLGITSTPILKAIGSGIINAGAGLATGQSPLSVLKSSALGALGGYGSSLIGTSGMSPLARASANIGMNTGMSGLRALLNKGDVGAAMKLGALNSAVNTGLGSLSNYAQQSGIGSNYSAAARVANPLIKQMLYKQLYKS